MNIAIEKISGGFRVDGLAQAGKSGKDIFEQVG
jgi:hypothetical protein